MGDIEEVVLEHPVMNSDLSDPANGATALKHIRQQVYKMPCVLHLKDALYSVAKRSKCVHIQANYTDPRKLVRIIYSSAFSTEIRQRYAEVLKTAVDFPYSLLSPREAHSWLSV